MAFCLPRRGRLKDRTLIAATRTASQGLQAHLDRARGGQAHEAGGQQARLGHRVHLERARGQGLGEDSAGTPAANSPRTWRKFSIECKLALLHFMKELPRRGPPLHEGYSERVRACVRLNSFDGHADRPRAGAG